jgi:hypothetical protein
VRALHLAAHVYTHYFVTGGKCVVEAGPGIALVRLSTPDPLVRAACLAALAYFRSAVELAAGARVEAREARCSRWGDRCCEFEFRWNRSEA